MKQSVKPALQVASLNNMILAMFITVKVVSMLNPQIHWFNWFFTLLIPVGIQLLLILGVYIGRGLGARIGQAIYFRQLERTMSRELKKGAAAAKAYQKQKIDSDNR